MKPQFVARFFCIAALAMPCVLLTAQTGALNPSDRKPSALVVGQVIDAVTSQPIAAATVTMTPSAAASRSSSSGAFPSTLPGGVMADDQGRFLFRDLDAGAYAISAAAPGYLDGGYGQRQPGDPIQPYAVAAAERTAGVAVRLWKCATVGGTVTDESGGPVVDVSVGLVRRDDSGDRVQFVQVPSARATTDDRGAYQISGLPAGDYLAFVATRITAMPVALATADAATLGSLRASGSTALSMGMTAMSPAVRFGDFLLQTSSQGNLGGSNAFAGRLPASTLADGRALMYPTMFYPGATTPVEASVVTLAVGEERLDIDLRIRPVVMMRVSGHVTGPGGPEAHLAVHLIPAYAANQPLEQTHEAAVTATDARGAFTFPAVASGQYVVKAWRLPVVPFGAGADLSEPSWWSQASITVGDTEVTGVALDLERGLALSGRVEFDGTSPVPSSGQIQTLLSVCFEPAWPLALSARLGTRVNGSGEFITQGVPAGTYVPHLPNPFSPKGWYLESVAREGKDLMISPITVAGEDVRDIVIRFSDRQAELSGSVRAASGSADSDTTVIVFPADYQTWIRNGMSTLASRAVPTSQRGTYAVPDVTPGDYLIAAVAGSWRGSSRNPSAIEAIAPHATRVSVRRGQITQLDLRTTNAR